MFKYLFNGKLEPVNLIKDLDFYVELVSSNRDFGISGTTKISIKGSSVKVTFESEENYKESLETLKNFIQENVELIINAFGYTDSFYLDVYLLEVSCDELDINWVFGIKGEHNLRKSQEDINKESHKILNILSLNNHTLENNKTFIKDVFLDFKLAIKYPSQTAQFCYRAIETIRSNNYDDASIVNNDRRRKEGWKKLCQDLGYSREDFLLIEKFGIPNRHGKYPAIMYPTREEIMNFTRNLIDKFLGKLEKQ